MWSVEPPNIKRYKKQWGPIWHNASKSRWIHWSLKLAVRLRTVQRIEPGVASRAGQACLDFLCTEAQTSVTSAYPAWLDHGAFWIVIPRDNLSAKTMHEKDWEAIIQKHRVQKAEMKWHCTILYSSKRDTDHTAVYYCLLIMFLFWNPPTPLLPSRGRNWMRTAKPWPAVAIFGFMAFATRTASTFWPSGIAVLAFFFRVLKGTFGILLRLRFWRHSFSHLLKMLLRTTSYYKVLVQYYSVLQSTTKY